MASMYGFEKLVCSAGVLEVALVLSFVVLVVSYLWGSVGLLRLTGEGELSYDSLVRLLRYLLTCSFLVVVTLFLAAALKLEFRNLVVVCSLVSMKGLLPANLPERSPVFRFTLRVGLLKMSDLRLGSWRCCLFCSFKICYRDYI